MAGSPIDDRAVGNIFAVMDQYGPEVNKTEEKNVGDLLEWEYERKYVVWDTLRPSIQRMEGM